MGHSTIRATILPSIIQMIMERYYLTENAALSAFYNSATGAAFSDDDTGLYGQSPLYIFGLYVQEQKEQQQ